jgi:hypothetical protein
LLGGEKLGLKKIYREWTLRAKSQAFSLDVLQSIATLKSSFHARPCGIYLIAVVSKRRAAHLWGETLWNGMQNCPLAALLAGY